MKVGWRSMNGQMPMKNPENKEFHVEETHLNGTPQPKRRVSPWAEFSDQRRASARKYKDLRNELGLAFREVQQKAQEQWVEWDNALS